MKYIDADKLIAEIENMFDNGYYCTPKNIGKQQGRNKVCRKILSLITSLQQEQSEVDLEKAIQEHIKECLDVKFPTTDIELIKKDVAYTARKFYELGFNTRKEEQ